MKKLNPIVIALTLAATSAHAGIASSTWDVLVDTVNSALKAKSKVTEPAAASPAKSSSALAAVAPVAPSVAASLSPASGMASTQLVAAASAPASSSKAAVSDEQKLLAIKRPAPVPVKKSPPKPVQHKVVEKGHAAAAAPAVSESIKETLEPLVFKSANSPEPEPLVEKKVAPLVPKEGAYVPGLVQQPTLPVIGEVVKQDARSPRTVRLKDGVNEVVYLSTTMPNRIATPFSKPKVIDVDAVDWKVVGQDVYLIPKTKDATGVFITDEAPGSSVASLTVIPKEIIGQNILLALDKPAAPQLASAKEMKDNSPDYMDQVRLMMKMVALGQTPPGFAETPLNVGVARFDQLMVTPVKQLAGQTLDLFIYRLDSMAKVPVELQESNFYQEGVRAVAFWPNLILLPRESTQIFILADKPGVK